MTATYRLQLHADFDFAAAVAVVPYLAELGITHLYLSPILQAADGSTHGYDVVDPETVSTALGGEAGFASLVAAVRAHDMNILLDIVPNHMSIAGTNNRWWLDVLENGVASYYADFFDVDWAWGDERVSLPVLGERYGRALASGSLGVTHDGHGGFAIRAGDLHLPIAPRALSTLVKRCGERIQNAELAFIGESLDLPRKSDPEVRRRRHRDKAVLLQRLRELAANPDVAQALDAEVGAVNADRVELDALLEAQAYRLVHWSVSGSQLSYRRFFDINTLVGVRNEDPEVLAASHRRILNWLVDGTIAGIRIDHVDGLRDPAKYFARLRDVAPNAWIVVEKILGSDERIPAWPIDGTTGYEFAERVSMLLVDPAGEKSLTDTFEAYTGQAFDPAAASRVARHEVMSDALHSELMRLVELAARACAASPSCRDFTRDEIQLALSEIFAGYPVYRTYFDQQASDRGRIAQAAQAAQGDRDLISFLESALAFEVSHPDALDLARAAQQTTGAIVAKGDEDTLGYRQVRLASRCEVGADLKHFSQTPEVIHRALAASPPRSLLATSTHDTKRGEDVRARIAVLSEVPAAWAEAVGRWRERTSVLWGHVDPDRTLEYLVWQTLVGAWPVDLARTSQFAFKAAREARLRTSWRKQDADYEGALSRWLEGIFADAELMADVERFARAVIPRGNANSLAQLAIKLTAPGAPDIYQGAELADRSLVDPDNRRPIDYADRRARLRQVADVTASPELAADLDTAKIWMIRRLLGLRRRKPELFAGPYQAVDGGDPHVFAFARNRSLITIVPRIGAAPADTAMTLPDGNWRDVLSDRVHTGSVKLGEVWEKFPVAVLVASQ